MAMYSKSTCFKHYYMNSGVLIRSCFSKVFNLAKNGDRQLRVISFCGHSLYKPLYIVPKSVQEREHKLLVMRNSSLTAVEPNTIDDCCVDHQLLEEFSSSRSIADLGYVSFTPVVDHLYDYTNVPLSVQRLDVNQGETLLMAGPLVASFTNPQVFSDVIYLALPPQPCSTEPLLLTGIDNTPGQGEEKSEQQPEKASETQLLSIKDHLCDSVTNFFTRAQSFSVYRKDIEFQNNIKCVTTKGVAAYMIQMYLLKFYGHLHYARVKADILKITHHTEDCTVRVRWRVDGVSRRKLIFHLHKFKNKNWEEFLQDQSEWLDGFSVFSVDRNGLIFKHVCDKMIPDDEELALKPMSFKSRLLTILGLANRPPSVSGVHNVTSCNTFRALKQSRKNCACYLND